MDRPEIVAKRGYETFAEHYVKKGHEEEREDTVTVLREEGLSEEMITSLKDTGVRYEATSEDEVTYLSLTIPNRREEL